MSHIEPSSSLLDNLRNLILQARQQAVRSVNAAQVQTYWQIGRHIVEFEQEGEKRAGYGQRLFSQLGQTLSREFGKGFDATNLRHTRGFYLAFPIRFASKYRLALPRKALIYSNPFGLSLSKPIDFALRQAQGERNKSAFSERGGVVPRDRA